MYSLGFAARRAPAVRFHLLKAVDLLKCAFDAMDRRGNCLISLKNGSRGSLGIVWIQLWDIRVDFK